MWNFLGLFYRPAVVLTCSEGMATGSARSVSGFDVYKAVQSCEELLENFGGHTYAAGLTLKVEVKTRSEGLTIDPILAVDETKMRNLAIAANAYVKQMGIDADVRFDIITVVGMDSRHCDVIHTEDAFNPLLLRMMLREKD